jgi:hypothetical protein
MQRIRPALSCASRMSSSEARKTNRPYGYLPLPRDGTPPVTGERSVCGRWIFAATLDEKTRRWSSDIAVTTKRLDNEVSTGLDE